METSLLTAMRRFDYRDGGLGFGLQRKSAAGERIGRTKETEPFVTLDNTIIRQLVPSNDLSKTKLDFRPSPHTIDTISCDNSAVESGWNGWHDYDRPTCRRGAVPFAATSLFDILAPRIGG